MSKKIRNTEVDHLFDAILTLELSIIIVTKIKVNQL